MSSFHLSPFSARVGDAPETKNPACFHIPGISFWRRPTLARPIAVLPSGLQRFTAVFGMGTGGATALLSPEGGTALAVSLLSQRRKREAESLGTASILRSTINATVIDRRYSFQKNFWFSDIYIQEA